MPEPSSQQPLAQSPLPLHEPQIPAPPPDVPPLPASLPEPLHWQMPPLHVTESSGSQSMFWPQESKVSQNEPGVVLEQVPVPSSQQPLAH